MNRSFQHRTSLRYQWLAFTALFSAAASSFVAFFFLDDPVPHGFKEESSAAVLDGVGAAVFGTMLLLSVLMLAVSYTEQFSVHGTSLSHRSLFYGRRFDVSQLRRLTWKINNAGAKIRFDVSGDKILLDLYAYSPEDRLAMIRALRRLVPHELQDGWPMFCHRVALPLRDGKPSIVRIDPSTPLVRITRRRYDRMLPFALAVSVICALALKVPLDLWQFLAFPVVVIAAWLLLRYSIPVGGATMVPMPAKPKGIADGICVSLLASAVGLFVASRQESSRDTLGWIAVVVAYSALPFLIWAAYKEEKRRRVAHEQAAQTAEEVWRQGEPDAS